MNNEAIAISIIIPFYNAEPYVASCLDSILKFEELPVEIICVDDGSTDGTWSLLENYRDRDSRVILLHQQNLYAGRARNAGMKIARGRYITFIDADDMLYSTATLAKAYRQAVELDCDFLGCGAVGGFDPESVVEEVWVLHKDRLPQQKVCAGRELGCFAFNIFGGAPWSKLFKRSFLQAHGLEFLGLRRSEDFYVVELALALAERVSYLEEPLVFHRHDTPSSLEANKDKAPLTFWEATRIVLAKFKELGLLEEFKTALRIDILERIKYNLWSSRTPEGFEQVFNCARDEILPFLASLNVQEDNPKYLALERETNFYFKFSSCYDYLYYIFVKQRLNCQSNEPSVFVSARGYAKEATRSHRLKLSQPKISIIIPLYNVEPYLRNCLDSAVNQTLEDLEIICVDDGSTDGSLEILKEYAARDARIVIIEQPQNGGVSIARNVGAQRATGEYLYFLDSDDMLLPGAMEELYARAKRENLDVLLFEGITIFETLELEKLCSWCQSWCVRSREYTGVKSGRQMMVEMYEKKDYKTLVWIMLFRREFYIREKLTFSPRIKVIEDVLFVFECMMKAARVAHQYKKYYVRRVREESLTSIKKRYIRHPYGFFLVGMGIMDLLDKLDLLPEERAVAAKEVTRMFNEGQTQFDAMDEEEIEKYKELPGQDSVLFEHFLLKPYRNNRYKNFLRGQVEHRDQWLEKAKANLELQKEKTAKEVKGRQAAEKKAAGLAKALQDREKELRAQKAKTAKETKAKLGVQKKLKDIQTGISFRLGRLLTWLPRVLMGKK